MGKRRESSRSPNEVAQGDSNEDSSPIFESLLVPDYNLAVQILDLSGFFEASTGPDTSLRYRFIQSLSKLSTLLRQNHSIETSENELSVDISSFATFLDFEVYGVRL